MQTELINVVPLACIGYFYTAAFVIENQCFDDHKKQYRDLNANFINYNGNQ